MNGKSQKASGSASAPKSTGSSRPVLREVERSGAIPTNTVPDVSESSRPSTVTLSREVLERMIRLLKPDVDPTLILTQLEVGSTQPTTEVRQIPQPLQTEAPTTHIDEGGDDWFNTVGESGLQASDVEIEEPHCGATQVIEDEDEAGVEKDEQLEKGEEVEQQLHTIEKSAEVPTTQMDDVMDIVRQITTEEAEQPFLTAKEAAENLAAKTSEVERMDMEVEEDLNIDGNPTERVEQGPAEGVETNTGVPDKEEIVIVTDGKEEAEKVLPGREAAEQEVAAIRTYQRMPAREETSGRRTEEERLKDIPSQKMGGYVECPARSAARAPVHRRRLLVDEYTEEEDDVFFRPIEELSSQR